MNWWEWLITILLAISALGFSGWYSLSIGHYRESKKFIDWNRFLTHHQPLTEIDIEKLKNTPVALLMVVGDCDGINQAWQPLYLIPSTNIQVTITEWNQEIEMNYIEKLSHPISDYLVKTNQTPVTVKYYLFRHYRSEILLDRNFSKLMIKSQLKQIGFNQFF